MTSRREISWGPDEFELQGTTVWSFPERGDWATHDPKYRGNWSPYVPRNLILRYSQEGDVVLDQFVGSGTTLVEAKLLGRRGIGVDINPAALELTRRHLDFEWPGGQDITVREGDARSLGFIADESVDLIATHPPYADIYRYSDGIEGDLSLLRPVEFFRQMEAVASESRRVLKPGKFCAILMGDARRNGNMVPIGFGVMEVFREAGLTLKEIAIKEQHNCRTTRRWAGSSKKFNFLLIAHEYLLVFRKNR